MHNEVAKNAQTANVKEKFNLLYNNLAEFYANFRDNTFKIIGFYFLVCGWLLTSTTAQKVIGSGDLTQWLATVVLMMAAILSCILNIGTFRQSQSIYIQLSLIGYMPKDTYLPKVIQYHRLLMSLGGIVFVSVVTILVVWNLPAN